MAQSESKITLKNILTTYRQLLIPGKVNRLPRRYFWIISIINYLVMLPLIMLIGHSITIFAMHDNVSLSILESILLTIVALIFLFSNIKTMVARLHDCNLSGCLLLLGCLLPFLGIIIFLVAGLLGSVDEDNKYGAPFGRNNDCDEKPVAKQEELAADDVSTAPSNHNGRSKQNPRAKSAKSNVLDLDYMQIVDKISSICLDLNDAAGVDTLDDDEANALTHNADAGAALHKYAMLLLHERLVVYEDDEAIISKEDNKIIEVFASKLMTPESSLRRMLTSGETSREWADFLMGLNNDSLNMTKFIDRVNKVIYEA